MKKYGRVKVKDPSTDGHTVKLLPFQGMEVVCTKNDPTDNFNLLTVGEFLVLTETLETEDKVVYKVEQKYDMTGWAKISTTFMGNIHIYKSIGGIEEKVRLCVYCIPDCPTKDNVVTVIKPDDVLVKVEPHQLLHVVMYDDREQARWSIDNPTGLNCVRCETVVNDFQSVYDTDALFCPEPRSHGLPMNQRLRGHPSEFFSNEVLGTKGLTIEYHFWSCISSSEIAKLHNMANGSYTVGTVTLAGEYDNRQSFRRMEIMLSVRGNRSKLNIEHFKAIYTIAKCWNERSLSYIRHSIFNPRTNENLDVSDADGWFYLEIPNPSIYFNELEKDCQWRCEEIERANIQCHELRSRYINGSEVQRFLITGITGRTETDLMDLGAVHFSASNNGITKSIHMNFWKIPSSTINNQPIHREEFQIEIELEVMNDGKLADDSDITPLRCIGGNDIDYSEYSSEDYLRSIGVEVSKKKFLPLALPYSGTSTSSSVEMFMGAEIPTAASIGS